MTQFTADLFHRGSLWGLAGRDCAIRGAFSSVIHSALVVPFQCWWVCGFEEEGGKRTLQRAVPDPMRVCSHWPFLMASFRPSSLMVCAVSPRGVFAASEWWTGGSLGSSKLLQPWWLLCVFSYLSTQTYPTQHGAAEKVIIPHHRHSKTLPKLSKVEEHQGAWQRAGCLLVQRVSPMLEEHEHGQIWLCPSCFDEEGVPWRDESLCPFLLTFPLRSVPLSGSVLVSLFLLWPGFVPQRLWPAQVCPQQKD